MRRYEILEIHINSNSHLMLFAYLLDGLQVLHDDHTAMEISFWQDQVLSQPEFCLVNTFRQSAVAGIGESCCSQQCSADSPSTVS